MKKQHKYIGLDVHKDQNQVEKSPRRPRHSSGSPLRRSECGSDHPVAILGHSNRQDRRNRGHRVPDVIDELHRYVTGWLQYFGISHTYKALLALDDWVRRRVRLYYWKQWKQPRTRRRHLLALGIAPEEVRMATRSRKGYWRMSANSLVQRALTNRWLHEHGVPDLRTLWMVLHYGPKARV